MVQQDERPRRSILYQESPIYSIIAFTFAVLAILFLVNTYLNYATVHNQSASRLRNCPRNLKECVNALSLYCSDYDNQLPSSYLVSKSRKWNRDDFLIFATKVGKLPPDVNCKLQTWPQILYNHMKYKDVMWCLSDAADAMNPDSPVSYWYKLAMDKAWYGEQCAKPYKRASDYAYNADQIVFYEHQGWHFGTNDGLRTGRQVNAAFMDSHVEPIIIKNATSGDPLDCGANTDGEPMYYNYDNVKKIQDIGPAKHLDPSRFSDKF